MVNPCMNAIRLLPLLLLAFALNGCHDAQREAELARAKDLTVRIQIAMEKGCRHQDLVELEAETARLLRTTSRIGDVSNYLGVVESRLGNCVLYSELRIKADGIRARASTMSY